MFCEYEFPEDIKDRIVKVALEIKYAKKQKYFPRTANKFCPGCPMFNECHPVEIGETYKQCKALADLWTEKAKEKKAQVVNKMTTIGTDVLPDPANNTTYYLKTKNFTDPDIEDLITVTKGDLNILKKWIKPTKDELKQAGYKDIKTLPQRTQVELHYKDTL